MLRNIVAGAIAGTAIVACGIYVQNWRFWLLIAMSVVMRHIPFTSSSR
jgi:hypothetical protein